MDSWFGGLACCGFGCLRAQGGPYVPSLVRSFAVASACLIPSSDIHHPVLGRVVAPRLAAVGQGLAPVVESELMDVVCRYR